MTLENREQILASDPAHSVWVSASAGTGKTKVLTDRVLRLLLADVPLEKILCLTFTNAAATEMTNRVSNVCLEWKTDTGSLAGVLGRAPTKEEIFKAKRLFSKLMLSPRQLPSHTIHSFCQKILQSFPFEAGLQPGFKVISEPEAEEIIEQVVRDLGKEIENFASLQENVKSNEAPLFRHITFLLQNLHENTFLEIIREILSDRIYFQELFKQFSGAGEYEKFLKQKLDVKETAEELQELLLKNIDDETRALMPGGGKEEADITGFFLTAKGEPKKKLLTKKESDSKPGLETKLRQMQEYVCRLDQKIKTARMIKSTVSVYAVSEYVISKYSFYKRQKGNLDYDDLIYRTKELLTSGDMREWVLYKLDGGLHHLLVDEAQDTSPEQWQIIEAVISEFYSGSSRSEENRTIFIVGDEKQSIYSFQGADISNFNRFNEYIRGQMLSALKSYKDARLVWSYRSCAAIVEFIEHMSGLYSVRNRDSRVHAVRQSEGFVEIWPLYRTMPGKKELFWPLTCDMQAEEEAHLLPARDIAQYISNYIKAGIILPSTGKPAKAEDFMILVRRRNAFMEEMISALKDQGVSVGGMDRMVLTDHISVQDILSLARYALMPRDELSMAAFLKSPIIGMNDEKLLQVLILLREARKEGTLIFEKPLAILEEEYPVLKIISGLALSVSASEFFYNLTETLDLRKVLVKVNGPSTNDVLDELLNLVIQFEKSHSSNLQEFLYWTEKKEIEIKRDSNASEAVRVMTVHGSKGLEAPIVILADTTSLPIRQTHLVWEGGMYLWQGGSQNANEYFKNIKNSLERLDYQEYLRLLYVALSRAEDHLIIVGSAMRENIPEGCFYDVASKVMSSMEHKEEEGYKWIGERIIVPKSSDTQLIHKKHVTGGESNMMHKNDLFCRRLLENKKIALNIPQETEKLPGPLDSRTSLNYGQLIHKILEDSVNTGNFKFSPNHPMLLHLSQEIRDSVMAKMSKLFAKEEFITLIQNTEIKTEVSIGYQEEEGIRIGRIDLLSVAGNKVTVIDYKTDKRVPVSSSLIPEGYIKQLRFYAEALKKIYPDYQVDAKILWIENLSLMNVEQEIDM